MILFASPGKLASQNIVDIFFNYTLNIAIIDGNFLSEVLGGVFSLFILSRFELISLSFLLHQHLVIVPFDL